MRGPEEYAEDFPDDPQKALVAGLLDRQNELRTALLNVPEEEEARALLIEHLSEIVRDWQDGR